MTYQWCNGLLNFLSEEREVAHIVIIAVWTELVALFIVRHILPKCLLALLAHERHLSCLP